MTGWPDDARIMANGVEREALFFPSDADQLYAALYLSERPGPGVGLVISPSWGLEADRLLDVAHFVALGVAERGGAGLVYHPPGHGDSGGQIEEADMSRMKGALLDAVGVLRAKRPDGRVALVGMRLGAGIAAAAWREAGADTLVMIQPALDAADYFQRMERSAQRFSKIWDDGDTGMFGHPVDVRVTDEARSADLGAGLAGFEGRGLVVRSVGQPSDPSPPGFEERSVGGDWLKIAGQRAIAAAVVSWLTEDARSDGALERPA